jgi:hypothetical protein
MYFQRGKMDYGQLSYDFCYKLSDNFLLLPVY